MSGERRDLAIASPATLSLPDVIGSARPTMEEATITAITLATNACFNWRGQEELTPLMAVNVCAAVIAYLRAIPPGYSPEEMAIAVESLEVALGSGPRHG